MTKRSQSLAMAFALGLSRFGNGRSCEPETPPAPVVHPNTEQLEKMRKAGVPQRMLDKVAQGRLTTSDINAWGKAEIKRRRKAKHRIATTIDAKEGT